MLQLVVTSPFANVFESFLSLLECVLSVIFHISANMLLMFMSGLQDIDEYELVDPVDILTPLSKSVFWEGVVSSIPSYLVVLHEVMVSVYCVRVLASFSTSGGRSF